MKKRVLLVNPPNYRLSGASCNWCGVGLQYLAQSLNEKGHYCKIYNSDKGEDMTTLITEEFRFFESDKIHLNNFHSHDFLMEIVHTILDFNPDVVGFYCYTNSLMYITKIVEECRRLNSSIRFIGGGIHWLVTQAKDKNIYPFDAVCISEGEELIEKMLVEDGILGGGTVDINKYKHISEDVLLDVDFDILANIETSRGCPYKCVFCVSGSNDEKLRSRDPEIVAKEMEYRMSKGIKYFYFTDELFVKQRKYLLEMKKLIPKDAKFIVETRVDAINDEKISTLAEMGCFRIKFGVEVGTQHQLDVLKKKFTLQQAADAIALTKSYGIEAQCNHILGCPDSDEDEYMKSIEWLINADADWYSTSILMPFLGTVMYDDLLPTLSEELILQMMMGRQHTTEWYDYWGLTDKVLKYACTMNDKKKHQMKIKEEIGSIEIKEGIPHQSGVEKKDI